MKVKCIKAYHRLERGKVYEVEEMFDSPQDGCLYRIKFNDHLSGLYEEELFELLK